MSGTASMGVAISATVGPMRGGQRRQGVEVEVVELGGVAGQDLAQLGLGGVAEPGPQVPPA